MSGKHWASVHPVIGFTDEKKFWYAVDKRGADDCWNWKFSTRCPSPRGGYGQMHFRGKYDTSHRISYLINCGEIPQELQVLHKCNNRSCCNPKHLKLGTSWDNRRDAMIAGTIPNNFAKYNEGRRCKMYYVELVWNREFDFVSYGGPHTTIEEAIKFVQDIENSGDGARVKKSRIINDDTEIVVWAYGKRV